MLRSLFCAWVARGAAVDQLLRAVHAHDGGSGKGDTEVEEHVAAVFAKISGTRDGRAALAAKSETASSHGVLQWIAKASGRSVCATDATGRGRACSCAEALANFACHAGTEGTLETLQGTGGIGAIETLCRDSVDDLTLQYATAALAALQQKMAK